MRPPRLQFRLRGHRRKQHWRPAIRLVLVAAAASVMLEEIDVAAQYVVEQIAPKQ
jgi:hypothetical protein